jgi:hypothetical protein
MNKVQTKKTVSYSVSLFTLRVASRTLEQCLESAPCIRFPASEHQYELYVCLSERRHLQWQNTDRLTEVHDGNTVFQQTRPSRSLKHRWWHCQSTVQAASRSDSRLEPKISPSASVSQLSEVYIAATIYMRSSCMNVLTGVRAHTYRAWKKRGCLLPETDYLRAGEQK